MASVVSSLKQLERYEKSRQKPSFFILWEWDSVKRSKFSRQKISPPDHARASPSADGAPALAFESNSDCCKYHKTQDMLGFWKFVRRAGFEPAKTEANASTARPL